MRKGIKILAKLVSIIILLSIFLPISLTLVLNVDDVQNRIIKLASQYATDYLGAEVSIGRIDLDLFSRVRIEDFYVEDHEQDTLLYVESAWASIRSLNIARDGLLLRSAKLVNGEFNLRELPNGELNIRPIIARLQRNKSESNFCMVIDDIEASGLTFRYERQQHRDPEYGIDYYDMEIGDITTSIERFSVAKSKVWATVKSLSARERSGFTIDNLTTDFSVHMGQIAFMGFECQTPTSRITVPELLLKGDNWDRYKEFIENVQMIGRVECERLTTEDLAYFAPAMRYWDTSVSNVVAPMDGLVCDLNGVIERATIAEYSSAEGTFRITGLPDWRTSQYVVGLQRVKLDRRDIRMLLTNVPQQPLPRSVMDIVERLGNVSARLTFGGRLNGFRAVGNVAATVGELSADVTLRRGGDGRYNVTGTADTDELDIGSLLDVSNLHNITSNIVVNGSVGDEASGGVVGDVTVDVSSVGYGSYRYSAISGKVNVDGGEYHGIVTSKDPNLEFSLYADMDLGREVPEYAFSLGLERADLHALGFNKRDTVSVLSAHVGVDLVGEFYEGLGGYVSIADANYSYPGSELHTDLVRLNIESDNRQKSVELESDFVDLEYHSHSSYRDVYEYIYNSLKRYVPLLYDNAAVSLVEPSAKNSPADYTIMTLKAGEAINDLLDAIAGGLVVAPNTELDLVFNPKSNNISLRGSSEAIEYSGIIFANNELNVNNNSLDSLSVRLKSEGVYMGQRLMMPKFDLIGGARENRISLTAGFKQTEGTSSAMLGLSAQFSRNELTRRRSVHIDITPSHFTNDTQQWKLYSRGIDIDSTRISIHELHIARPDQQLILDGVVSRQRDDSISLKLDNFDISPISALLGRYGYNVSGVVNGYAQVKSALSTPEIDAAISLDSISVNGIKAPPQDITSKWDFENNRARVFVLKRGTTDTVIRGYYQPQGNRYYARADMENMKLKLLSPFLGGILSDIEGDADINATVRGQGGNAVLAGGAVVDNIGVTVDYTKVRYRAPKAELRVENNHFIAERVPVYDMEGNSGNFSMDISLEKLSNITYDVDVEANRMLVIDTDSKDNNLFYGHVYGSGTLSLTGDKRGVKMDIEGTSADNSHFYMPLSGKEDVSYADFVRFEDDKREAPDTTAFLTRRMMAYERKSRQISESEGVMDMDITLNILPNIEMQLVIDPTVGDVIKGKGSGQLNMHIVPKANIFEMRGDVQISDGTYLFTLQNIINKLFTVVPGSSIHWDGEPLGAQLNIDAVYSTKASLRPLIGGSVQGIDTSRAVPVDCYIKLTDELMSPTVTFDVQVPNVAPEIQTVIQSMLNDQQAIATQMLWLLAANSFSAEDTGSMGASLSATTGFELLSNQLSNWLSGDNYNIIFRYRPRTELSGDEVDFGFSKSWFNNRLIVELEGGYLSDASKQATAKASNFVGEAFITWLIDPDGAFRFKGFTQTIDRYGENQGMQESGIGVYYSESFNTFKELRKSIKNRFAYRDSLGRVITRREHRDIKREERDKRRVKRDSQRLSNKMSDK